MQHVGARPSELVLLDWSQIDLVRGEVHFPSTDEADERTVPLRPLVSAALKDLPHRKGRVLRPRNREKYERTNATAFKTALAKASKRAGVRGCTYRVVHMTWAIWTLAELDGDLDALMVLGGWRDQRALTRYKNVSVADLEALRAALREQHWDHRLAEASYGGAHV